MKILNPNQTLSVYGGSDSDPQDEGSPSFVGDMMFFISFGAAGGGFGGYMLASLLNQNASLLALGGATTTGVLLGVGACIGIAAILS